MVAVGAGLGMSQRGDGESWRLSWLNERIVRYVHLHGDYPRTLQELCEKPAEPGCGIPLDSWDRPYWYRRLGDGYELFSSGSDGLPWTEDDIRVERQWGKCMLVWAGTEWKHKLTMASLDPRDVAGMELDELEGKLIVRQVAKDLPLSLEALGGLGIGRRRADVVRLVDPWGRRYEYRIAKWGYDLYSCGPDGVPGTEDDIRPGDESEACRWPSDPGSPVETWRCQSTRRVEQLRRVKCSAIKEIPAARMDYERLCGSGDDKAECASPDAEPGQRLVEREDSQLPQPTAPALPIDMAALDSGLTGGRPPSLCSCSFVGLR